MSNGGAIMSIDMERIVSILSELEQDASTLPLTIQPTILGIIGVLALLADELVAQSTQPG